MATTTAPPPDAAVLQTLEREPHSFLQPSQSLHTGFLELAKLYLDPVANQVSELQTARQKHARSNRKRKRRSSDVDGGKGAVLGLKRVHVDGFNVHQVWEQAKRVMGAAGDEVERGYPDVGDEEDFDIDASGHSSQRKGAKKVHFADDNALAAEEISEDESLGEEGVDWVYDGEDVSEDGDTGRDEEELNHSDADSLDIGEETPPSEFDDEEESSGPDLVKDKFGLNDGFFSIDDFNKQSQFLERVDARGDSDDGAASDEDDIDWSADPMAMKPQPQTKQKPKKPAEPEDDEELEDDESEDDEGGPTFGNADLNAPDTDSEADEGLDMDMDDDSGMGNANNITYKDFFAPPARQASKKEKLHKARLKKLEKDARKQNLATEPGRPKEDEDADLERTISSVHRDLFEDELSDEADPEDATQSRGKSNLSSHERRQLALREEIRKLEAANVAAKPWSLTGESLAPSRPLNSLLEEDLDFERAGKPVPVITEEVSEDIEALIKRRILAREFDEVVRRRPNELASAGAGTDTATPRGRLDEAISDSKPQKSLAEEYADDHLRATDPNYTDTRTAALQAKHKSIQSHWTAVSAQLDALCNWHYKPKPPAPSLEVRVDAPTISMEEARPTAAEGDMGGESMLAPQEVWNKGMDAKNKEEVVTKGGTALAREELSREEKQRRRRREKERIKKSGENKSSGTAVYGNRGSKTGKQSKGESRREEEANVVGQLKKGGVKVIGKKGNLTDVNGVAVGEQNGAGGGAGKFKL